MLVGGERLKTEAGKLCPDIETEEFFYEVKSIGIHGTFLLDQDTVEKYKILHKPLYFIFWFHDAKVGKNMPKKDMRIFTARHTKAVGITSLKSLKKITKEHHQWMHKETIERQKRVVRVTKTDMKTLFKGQSKLISYPFTTHDGITLPSLTYLKGNHPPIRKYYV